MNIFRNILDFYRNILIFWQDLCVWLDDATGKRCKEIMSLDQQQKAGESGDETEGTEAGSRAQPEELQWQIPLPHTELSNTILSHAPQTEFDLLVKSEELSRLLLKSTRFHQINCRVANMK